MEFSLLERLQGNGNNTASTHTPDVLSCLANLSNDEVFTSPEVVNQMLDMLPKDLFRNPKTKFLDPGCKTGVFLREIAKRLLEGLEPIYPDLQERIDHIFHEQLFGIAITELTSLLSRRSLYCSKYPNGRYSITHFNSSEGNIRFKKIQHTWEKGRCIYCGANKNEYDRAPELETHAYEFIHAIKVEEVYKMKFDVIIGNPPYQLSTGGGQAQATPLYDLFVEQAMKLNPRYLTMIIPARWYAGGFPAIKTFRKQMVEGNHIKEIHDYPNASDCFAGVEIKGGVCYFLWQKDYDGKTRFFNHDGKNIKSVEERFLLEKDCETVIRENNAISILHKVMNKNEESFSQIMSTLWPFTVKSSFDTFSKKKKSHSDVYAYVMKDQGWISKSDVIKNHELVDKIKLFVPRSVGSADPASDVVKPILAEKNSVCSGTYIICGPFKSKTEAENVMSYFNTRFFHFLLSLKKVSQDTAQGCYEFIPMQDFSKSWTDEELYEKYGFTKKEIDFIKSHIWPNKEVK